MSLTYLYRQKHMTQSPSDKIPTSISLEALEALHKAADQEADLQSSTDESYQASVERISFQILEDISDKFANEMIPKLLTLRLINQMIGWAQENQERAAEANDMNTFAGFTAMSSQLAAAGITIQNTYFGEHDFTHPLNEKKE
jgi:hypothetical protein